jgi:hypothetical protein
MCVMTQNDQPAEIVGAREDPAGVVARLRAEYDAADDLMRLLAAAAVRRPRLPRPEAGLTPSRQSLVEKALSDAFSLVVRWQVPDGAPDWLVAREAVVGAVAAERSARQLPEVADRLRANWDDAMAVRRWLRDAGLEAEAVAARLLPTWRRPLHELPGLLESLLGRCSQP